MQRPILLLLTFLLVPALQAQDAELQQKEDLRRQADSLLNSAMFMEWTGYRPGDSILIEGVSLLKGPRRFRLYTSADLAWAPFRNETIAALYDSIALVLHPEYSRYQVEIFAGKKALHSLVPNYFRTTRKEMDGERFRGKWKRNSLPLVRAESSPWLQEAALYQMNLAIWHSHGWYYEPELDRWEWQRARLFQTVEDLYPMAYTLPFVVPMLENAGAQVLLPRERDVQHQQVIVDNDGSDGLSLYLPAGEMQEGPDSSGFASGMLPFTDQNPFRQGSWSAMEASKVESQKVQWVPDIPGRGEYAVYVSYQASSGNVDDALYRVHHLGGQSEFRVNQQMGGGTWVYLGHFLFDEGVNQQGRVELSDLSASKGGRITADAVRFGGGMGSVSRNGKVSKRPRYQEAARYYMQFAGAPDSLTWKLNENDDYKDDYQGRGEWVNYLKAPLEGKKVKPGEAGLAIPVDLAFAFHTDAGIRDNDTVVGTLGIYSSNYEGSYFPDGRSKMASRDLTDLIQTQIVEDLRKLYDPAWTRRGMWDKAYSEAYRPEVPTMLLELFSHQNFLDMQFGQEPLYRFHVSRAIYKGMLKFLSQQYELPYVVQPLPPTHLRTSISDGKIRVDWEQQPDPLEPTALAGSFVVYVRKDEGGFANGVPVEGPSFTLEDPEPGRLYSFKVTALNPGGESLPSEILAAGIAAQPTEAPEIQGFGPDGEAPLAEPAQHAKTLAIIQAFDRVSGPARMDDTKYAGFMNMVDEGVAWGKDIHTVGSQYDFRRDSPWLDDDSPGHGASYADLEAQVLAGNDFDFASVHGASILRAGHSFVSISDEALEEGLCGIADYPLVDFLAGEEKSICMPKNDSVVHFRLWTDAMLEVLEAYLDRGGKLFINGAHIASDAEAHGQGEEIASLLGFSWRTSNASRLGRVSVLDTALNCHELQFNTLHHPEIYRVEGADALEAADSTARTIFRYSENNMSAGVAYGSPLRVLSVGFPFEAMVDRKERDNFMKEIINYLLNTND